jgi:hypothetical protein
MKKSKRIEYLEKMNRNLQKALSDALEREKRLMYKSSQSIQINDRKFLLADMNQLKIIGDVTAEWFVFGDNIEKLTYHSQRREEK